MNPETCKSLYNCSILGELVGVVLYLYNFFGPHQPKATHISLYIVGFCAVIQIVLLITRKKWDNDLESGDDKDSEEH